ncbi:hypothetical protein KBD20_02905 [Candidatus Saccharibacteria bacterium]|nr:hypothetical protein [Candidatus Saccharibacteria bacterium]
MRRKINMSIPEQAGDSFQVDLMDLNPDFLCFQPQRVTEALEELRFPRSILSPLTTEAELRDRLFEGGYVICRDLEVPTERGRVDFKEMHVPLVELITERNNALLPGLSDFEKQYVTGNGSTEAISRLMAGLVGEKKMTRLGVIKNDYPVYALEAIGLGIDVDSVNSLEEAGDPVEGRVWFVSNPSAVDGNWHSNEVWQGFVEAGHDVVVDAAYMDLTADEHPLDVSARNIKGVVTSPSNKPHGHVFDRYPGIAYTRGEVFSLFIARAFRPVERLITMAELNDIFPPHELAREHTDRQRLICAAIGRLTGVETFASDSYLTAHNKERSFRLSTVFALLQAGDDPRS